MKVVVKVVVNDAGAVEPGPAPTSTGLPSTIQAPSPPSSNAAERPSMRNITTRRPAVTPPVSSYATTTESSPMPSALIAWAKAAGVGSGWRPSLAGKSRRVRSRSRSTQMAPGK